MAARKKKKPARMVTAKLPRLFAAEQDALVNLCVYSSVCPKGGRVYEKLVLKGYASRFRSSAEASSRGVLFCYRETDAGKAALRLVRAAKNGRKVNVRRRGR